MSTTRTIQIGVFQILTIVFVVLKLTEEIDWPWKWVLSPIWIPYALWAVVLLVAGFIWLLAGMFERLTLTPDQREGRKRNRAARKALADYQRSLGK